MAGCCRGGTAHSCDFTPPVESGGDAGTDGPLLCGSEVCEDGKVCCVTKAPLNATCIEPARFEALHCEKIDLPCFQPSDCPRGIACCVSVTADGSGIVSCRPQSLCGAGMTYVACASDGDCPSVRPTCTPVSSTPQGEFKVCM